MQLQLKPYQPHYKALAQLGIPIIIGQIGSIVLGFADTLMIGRHSTAELGAAALREQHVCAGAYIRNGIRLRTNAHRRLTVRTRGMRKDWRNTQRTHSWQTRFWRWYLWE